MPGKISVSLQGNEVVLTVTGRLTDEGKALFEAVTQQLNEGRNRIIVDLSQCTGINSTGLGYLVGAYAKVRNSGGNLVISGSTPAMGNLLQATKLKSIFSIYDSAEAAAAALERGTET